jgi:hypothetical protein
VKPYLLRTVLALGALLLASTATADSVAHDVRVYAPTVSNSGAILTLDDVSARGVLVELRLHHADGEPLRFGRHPVRITRAVPPQESMRVYLAEFLPAEFDGSFELTSTGAVGAVLETDDVVYSLIRPATSGEIVVDSRAGDRIEIAVVAIGLATDIRFEERVGTGIRSRPGLTLAADETHRLTIRIDDAVTGLRWESMTPIALVSWDGQLEAPATAFLTR